METIFVTSTRSDDPDYVKFIETCQSAFPTKIEEKYVALANDVYEYLLIGSKLYSNTPYREVDNIRRQTRTKDELSLEFEEVSKKLNDLDSKQGKTVDDYRTLLSLAEQKESLEKRISSENVSISDNRAFANEQNLETNKLRADLSVNIAKMSEDLKNIRELDIEGEKRIDRLAVENKHLEQLNFLNKPEFTKEMCKNKLLTDFNMKVSSFKYLESFAEKAIEEYSERKVINDTYDEERLASCLALEMLQSYGLNDEYGFRAIPGVLPVSLENEKKENEFINLAIDYLDTGAINEQAYEKIVSPTAAPYHEFSHAPRFLQTIHSVQKNANSKQL